MVKQAPTPLRLFTIVAFALSCFGLLLFMWNAFGGPSPLKPKGYRVVLPVPDSTQLALQADVRVSGVTDRQGHRQAHRPAWQPHAGDDRGRVALRAGRT